MEKITIMLHPEQRAKLAELAACEHVSASEINRRAIDAYNPNLANPELEALAEAVIQSTQQAMQVIKQAHQAITEILNYFAYKKTNC